MGILIVVTTIAFSRRSGSTGLDMTTIQKMRYDKRAMEIASTGDDASQ